MLEKVLNPVEEGPSPWPKGEFVVCPNEDCPNVELVCPIGGEDWNKGDDWVLLVNTGFVVWAEPELKRDDWPNIDGDELRPNVFVVVDNDADPKRLDEVDALKGEELNWGGDELAKFKPPMLEFFGANGFEGIDEEKGFAADWPNDGEGDELKFIPPEGWPAGSGPPEISKLTCELSSLAVSTIGNLKFWHIFKNVPLSPNW